MKIPNDRTEAIWRSTAGGPEALVAARDHLIALHADAIVAGPTGAYLAALFTLGLAELTQFVADLDLVAKGADVAKAKAAADLAAGYV